MAPNPTSPAPAPPAGNVTAATARPRLRGVSHEVAAVVFPVLGLVIIAAAPSAGARATACVYTVGVTAMYAVSACYHRGTWSAPVRRRLRRVDHSMILVGIAATYTPITGVGVGGATGWAVVAIVWGLAAAGAVIRNVWLDAPSWLVAVVYVGVGWTALGVLPTLWSRLGVTTFMLVVAGGVASSLGAVVFGRRRPDPRPTVFGYHEVFHALVLLGGLFFYVAVLRVMLRG
ncbi:MAG TPA: hemolysin III family protein [Acidimicrobiales bacterium]|nr:hemolysin III family protein [Acidimicrobiales bacterium]